MIKNEIKQKLFKQVDLSFEEQINFLTKLVTFKSSVGQEGEAQLFYAQACRDLGMDVGLFQAEKEIIKSHPAYVEIGLDYSGRPNVIAQLQRHGEGRSLILNGHMDVVSPEPTSKWSVDPWGGEIKNRRLYGRGSSDMKAGLSANLFALKAILDCGFLPRGKVILESVIEEELGGSGGTLACLLHGITGDGMLITEPTQQNIFVTHPGIKYFRVKVFGRPAHAALSHEGVNAITKMVPIIKAIEILDQKRAESLSYPKVEAQTGRSCNLSMGKMSAGDWVSTVAGWATLECRVGFVPGETGRQVMDEIERTIRDAVKNDEWFAAHPLEIEWFGWDTEPWVEPEDSPFVQEFLATSQKFLTPPPRLTGASGGVDTRFGGMFGTPSIAFGPKGGNYHGIDEYVEMESLLSVTKILAHFIAEWSGLLD
jgi:acetylornithine deacetylase